MMGAFAAATQVAAEWVQKNADAITGLVKGVVGFAKAALPFVAAVGAIVGAIKLWRLALVAAAKARALVQALAGPKGWAILAAGAAAYAGAAAVIDKTSKSITEGMEKVGERTKKLKKKNLKIWSKVLALAKAFKRSCSFKTSKKSNDRLKESEKLALSQAKALYGPETQAVIAARIKLAQAEREAAIAQQRADNAGGTDEGLNSAAAQAANAQLVAAEGGGRGHQRRLQGRQRRGN